MRHQIGRALGYLGSGGVAALVDLGGFAALHAMGYGVLAASIASFLVAAAVNYLLSSLFVFRTALSAGRFTAFVAGASAGLAINASVTTLAARLLPIPPVAAKLIGIGVAFCFNFLLNTLIVFRAGDQAAAIASGTAGETACGLRGSVEAA